MRLEIKVLDKSGKAPEDLRVGKRYISKHLGT